MTSDLQDSEASEIDAESRRLFGAQLYYEAEQFFRLAVARHNDWPMLYNNCGYALEMQGKHDEALHYYRQALLLNPRLDVALVNRSGVAKKLKLYDDVIASQRVLMELHPADASAINKLANAYLRKADYPNAAHYAALYAEKTRGSRYAFPKTTPVRSPNSVVSSKLQHDIEQFRYMRDCGLLDRELREIPEHYERALDILAEKGPGKDTDRDIFALPLLRETYGRIIYMHPSPRCMGPTLTNAASEKNAEVEFAHSKNGVVVVDDFLSDTALKKLQEFCLYSTIWNATAYRFGRLGALFRDGFNAPLLFQIAEELAASMPSVIGTHFPLLHMWAFKYRHDQTATTPHADFAAVNVNFWITPDEANLDQNSGGLVIYDVEAPPEWEFDQYNRQGRMIENYLSSVGAKSVRIPYRCNRAIIFKSDLFHRTEPMTFKPDYANRRINVTFLFGDRRDTFVSA